MWSLGWWSPSIVNPVSMLFSLTHTHFFVFTSDYILFPIDTLKDFLIYPKSFSKVMMWCQVWLTIAFKSNNASNHRLSNPQSSSSTEKKCRHFFLNNTKSKLKSRRRRRERERERERQNTEKGWHSGKRFIGNQSQWCVYSRTRLRPS